MSAPRPAGRAGQRPVVGLGAPLLAALSLGLAPLLPEPHVMGKLRWVAGGAHGMGAMDWVDLAFHGAPWVWLFGALAVWAWRRSQSTPSNGESEAPVPPGH